MMKKTFPKFGVGFLFSSLLVCEDFYFFKSFGEALKKNLIGNVLHVLPLHCSMLA